MTKHTEGPWRVEYRKRSPWSLTGNTYIVCPADLPNGSARNSDIVAMIPYWDAGPNARLIASSPDMLAALQRCEAELAWAVQQQCHGTPWANQDGATALAMARAAIAKAKAPEAEAEAAQRYVAQHQICQAEIAEEHAESEMRYHSERRP